MLFINNLSHKITRHQNKIEEALKRVLNSGYLILGPEVKRFEEGFAAYLDIPYCISLANGTDAIELSLKAFDLGANDLVATVANAGMYTTTALGMLGAKPHFMDVDLNTHNTTLAEVVKAINAGAKAVVVTHLYGRAVHEIEAIAQYCKNKNIPLLEDCAQAAGAKINGRCVGTFGDAASFSFYPTKNLGALGDGGAVVTSNKLYADKIRALRQYGWSSKYRVELSNACNSRLDEMQAAILSLFLSELDADNERRRTIAHRYSLGFDNPFVMQPTLEQENDVVHLYVIRSTKRDELKAYLQTQNIASDVHYPIPDYKQPVFGTRFSSLSLEHTERLSQEILTLPCYPEMTDAEVDSVIHAINSWLV